MEARRLTASQVKTLTAPGMYSDGQGLNLRIKDTGAKSWVQRVTIDGKRVNLGLGAFPVVSLSNARTIADANSETIALNMDPRQAKPTRKSGKAKTINAPESTAPTFSEVADAFMTLRRPGLADSGQQWAANLRTYIYPAIGRKPVDQITTADVLAFLTPIWISIPSTAARIRQRVENVFDYSIGMGYRSDNPAGKYLTKVLPRQVLNREHFAALPYADAPKAVEAIREAPEVERLALEFLILTATRFNETRDATWDEINWECSTWEIPANRMKSRRPHRVPLSDRAIDILREAQGITGGEGLIFPTAAGRTMHNKVLLFLLERLEIPTTVHGFRSSFRDWVIEQTATPWTVAESALAHVLGSSTETAYARTDLFDKRRELMQAWADFISG